MPFGCDYIAFKISLVPFPLQLSDVWAQISQQLGQNGHRLYIKNE